LLLHTLKGRAKEGCCGVTRLAVYAPKDVQWLNMERAVSVSYDDRWKLFATGDPLPFEHLDRYEEQNVRERPSRDDVLAYCNALGIRPYYPSFYRRRPSSSSMAP
jgi:hypothetical protein